MLQGVPELSNMSSSYTNMSSKVRPCSHARDMRSGRHMDAAVSSEHEAVVSLSDQARHGRPFGVTDHCTCISIDVAVAPS